MDIFTEAFTYNGDGTFTITDENLRKVFYKLHIAEAVASSSLRKYDDYYQALKENGKRTHTSIRNLEDWKNLIRTEYGLEDVQALYKFH